MANSISRKAPSALVNLFAPQTLGDLDKAIEICKACSIGKPCIDTTQAGSIASGVMFIGEAPGSKEIISKRPFSGQAGKEFDRLLLDAGFYRDNIYTSNIVRARPVDGGKNRTPKDSEVIACMPHVLAEIDIVRPRVIVCLGGTSGRQLMRFKKTDQMTNLRGAAKTINGITYVMAYHPSFVMRAKKSGNLEPYARTIEDFVSAKKLSEDGHVTVVKAEGKKQLEITGSYRGLCFSKTHQDFLTAEGYRTIKIPSSMQVVVDLFPKDAEVLVMKGKDGKYFITYQMKESI